MTSRVIKIKLSDYVAQFIVGLGVKHVFGVTGGAIVHVFDSIGKNRDVDYICTQHEQGAAMAADAYSRVTRNIGVAIATTGPGATNLITGVACAHLDSIPTLFITGQVATSRSKGNSGVRQVGFQEIDMVSMFKPITKYAVLIGNPERIKYELEKAVHLAKSGRPGSVLIDIPDDVQRMDINVEELEPFNPEKEYVDYAKLENQIDGIMPLIENAKRPIVIAGAGIRLGNAEKKFLKMVERLKFPVCPTWAALDMFAHEDRLNAGGFGITSPRYGNFAVQNSDLIIALGTRLDTHHTGTPVNTFAREAKKVIVDVDEEELKKFERFDFHVDYSIHAEVNDFLDVLNKKLEGAHIPDVSEWTERIQGWKKRYDVCPKEYFDEMGGVNSYAFLKVLSEELPEGEMVITDSGGNLAQTMAGFRTKKNQMLWSAFNNSPMGYSLPASIGACIASGNKRVICIIGDGGIQMNIQELATIAMHNLPVKVFVFNNKGYGMIKQTQDDWLNSRYEASSIEGGVPVPDFVKIADAYGIKTVKIENHSELREKIRKVLDSKHSALCEVNIFERQRVVPMLKSGRPIEDSKPLLSREEFLSNMIVKPLKQCLSDE